ncbi:MAG: glycosyltransferase family 39 protein [Opitutaceae bacterium]|nr:glycosyltransferase family 39 protein [Opitutaceae bacterium]
MLGLALLLALGHAWLATWSMREKSTTADELAHVTGGYTFNHWHDYRLHPENGILPQRWEALPATLAGARYPAQDDDWSRSDVWRLGHRFFYESGNDHERMLFAARAMNALFGAATTLLVFFWSRRHWGLAGAVVSGLLCALCPTMLAHSGLATSDMAMTFFLLAALAAYWRHLHDPGWRALALSAALFGGAAVAKHTSVLLLPMAGLLILARLLEGGPLRLGSWTASSWPARLAVLGCSLAAHGAAVALAIWAFFGFRYAAFNPELPGGVFVYPWELMLSFGGLKARVIEFCRSWQLLPEGYLYGLAFVLKHAEARGAFLDGEYSIYGWVSFFPKAFLYKTPLSLLAAVAASAGIVALRLRTSARPDRHAGLLRAAPLLVLFAVYWAFSLASHLNIGHRHILPTYPVLYVFCGALGWWAAQACTGPRSRAVPGVVSVVALLGLHALTAARIYPHYLAYFNPLAGGPAQGYRHLVDSSLDWGQDLPGLQRWLAAHRQPGERLHLSYFGGSEPDFYGIEAVRLPMLPTFGRARPWYWCEPGLYAISATMLQHVYAAQRGPWTAENERTYQELRRNDAHFRALRADPDGRPELIAEISPPQWQAAWNLYESLRFSRLCHYLRARQPDAMIGYSILVFRLTREEIDDALHGPVSRLEAAITRALAARDPAGSRPPAVTPP